MKSKPTISVIIPFYREKEFLKQSIQSILNQNYTDYELVILDDGSPENAEDITRHFNDRRIRYIRKKNVGLAKNINRSLPLLSGEFIARLDQDDLSHKKRLSKQLAVFNSEPSIDCVFTQIKRFGTQKSWSENTSFSEQSYHEFEPFKDGCLVNSTMMVKKEVLVELGGYREAYYPSDDWDLELRMSQKYKIVVLNEELVSYRFHENANTYRNFKKMQNTRRWAEVNYYRRKEGKKEINFQYYLESRSFLAKIRHYLKDKSKLKTRQAGDYYLRKNYLLFSFNILMAFIFHPKTLLKRLSSAKSE